MRASPAASKSAQGAVEVQAAEAGGVVALAAAVGAGRVGEGGVDEGVGRRQARRGVGEVPGVVAGAAAEGGDAVAGGGEGGDDEAADGAGGAGDEDVHQRAGQGGEVGGDALAVVEGAPEVDQRARGGRLGVRRVPGLLVLEVQDADQRPVPELGQVEPDVLQQVVVDRQALPVGEEGLRGRSGRCASRRRRGCRGGRASRRRSRRRGGRRRRRS